MSERGTIGSEDPGERVPLDPSTQRVIATLVHTCVVCPHLCGAPALVWCNTCVHARAGRHQGVAFELTPAGYNLRCARPPHTPIVSLGRTSKEFLDPRLKLHVPSCTLVCTPAAGVHARAGCHRGVLLQLGVRRAVPLASGCSGGRSSLQDKKKKNYKLSVDYRNLPRACRICLRKDSSLGHRA